MQHVPGEAGHAYNSGDYRRVIELLEPYADYLPKKQVTRLDDARSKIRQP